MIEKPVLLDSTWRKLRTKIGEILVLVLFFPWKTKNKTGASCENVKRRGAMRMEVRNVNGHYEIYKDGAFVCSCDANELDEVVEEMGE